MVLRDPVLRPRFFLLEKKQNATPIWPPETEGFLAQDVKLEKEDTPCGRARCISHDNKRTISCNCSYLRQKKNKDLGS